MILCRFESLLTCQTSVVQHSSSFLTTMRTASEVTGEVYVATTDLAEKINEKWKGPVCLSRRGGGEDADIGNCGTRSDSYFRIIVKLYISAVMSVFGYLCSDDNVTVYHTSSVQNAPTSPRSFPNRYLLRLSG